MEDVVFYVYLTPRPVMNQLESLFTIVISFINIYIKVHGEVLKNAERKPV